MDDFSLPERFLESSRDHFEFYKRLGEGAMAQLEEPDFSRRWGSEGNSVAIIVKHLWGNMRSRWTDFLTSDGEKPWRDRDSEFDDDVSSRARLLEMWDEGWATLLRTMKDLGPGDLDGTVTLRGQELGVVDAIQRQLTHAAYHVGQIVYISKAIRDAEWRTLSIPRADRS